MKVLIIGIFLVCWTANSAISETQSHCNDAPDWPPGLFVKDEANAIRIAFTMWSVENPAMKNANQNAWSKGMRATLSECVWRVAEKPIPPKKYSTFVISIGARDGRFLGTEISD